MIKRLALFMALFVPLAFARTEHGIYTVNVFKGMNSHVNEYLLKGEKAHDVHDVRFNSIFGTLSKRPVMLSYGSTGSSAVTGLHRFYKSDGTQKLIASSSTYLYVGDDSAGTFTAIGQGYTDGARWEFITYDDIEIGFNGHERPIKYDGSTDATDNTDGHRTASDLVTELGAPFAELDTGTDLDASSWYQYKIAYYDGTSYYYSKARSNPIKTGAAVYNIALTDIPLGQTGTTKRYIYRTEGNSSRANVLADTTYYLVAEINDNTTTTYADSSDDATISVDNAPTWATASAGYEASPPIGKYPLIHQDRLFVAGVSTAKSNLYWSAIQNPDYYDSNDYEIFRPDDGDKITGIRQFLGILTVFKTNSISKYYTDASESDWSVSNPFSFIGCPAPYSIANTPMGIFYLSRNGIYRFLGQRSELVSDAVTKQINNILEANIDDAAGYFYNGEYRLAYTDETAGSTINNRVLIYDITRDSYTLDRKSVNVFTSLDSGTDYGDLYMGSSDTDGKVWIDEGESSSLYIGLKSELDDGTYDDSRSYNTEYNPKIELAWDCTIDGWLTELQAKDAHINTIDDIGTYLPNAIIDRPDKGGSWTSPAYNINASGLLLLRWNETLGVHGDVTFQVKTASTQAGLSGASWSSAVSNPSGSDISGITANDWIQVRANLSTDDIEYTPILKREDNIVWQLDYTKSSANQESAFLSYWESGWSNFGVQQYEKRITEIRVFYTATEGTLKFEYINNTGDISGSFSIDMSVTVPSDQDNDGWDEYRGSGDYKVFVYKPPANSSSDPEPIGYDWKFKISENGDGEWKTSRIDIQYTVEPRSE